MQSLIKGLIACAVAHGYDNQPAIARLSRHVETLGRQSARKAAPTRSQEENTGLAHGLAQHMEPGKEYSTNGIKEILLHVTQWGDISPQKTTAIARTAVGLGLVSRKRDDNTGRPLYFL